MRNLTLFFLLILTSNVGLTQTSQLVLPVIQNSAIEFASLSSDGRYTASSSNESVSIWETATGRLIRTIKTGEVNNSAFSADNKALLTGNPMDHVKSTIKLWDCETGKETKKVKEFGRNSMTQHLEFSKSGEYFLASVDSSTYVWSYPKCKLVQENLKGIGRFSLDGESVFLESGQNTITQVNISSGESTVVMPASNNEELFVRARAYAKEEILTADNDRSIQVWSIAQKKQLRQVKLDTTGLGDCDWIPQFSNDGSRFGAYMSIEWSEKSGPNPTIGYFVFWNIRSGKQITKLAVKADGAASVEVDRGSWGMFTPDLNSFVQIPIAFFDDPRAGIQVRNTTTGYFSCDFGVKSLEWAIVKYRAFKGPKSKVGLYNNGEFIMINLSDGNNSIFYPESGRLLNYSDQPPADFAMVPDDRWEVVLEDGLVFTIKEKSSNKIVAQLLISDDRLKSQSFEEAFKHPVLCNWAVTTPSGLFDASSDMMHKLHYVVGTETIGLDQLKARYHEPGLLPSLLGTLKNEIRNVDNLKLDDLYPAVDAHIEYGILQVTLTKRDGGMGPLRLAVNGKTVEEDINPKQKTILDFDLQPYNKYCLSGNNTISLVSVNKTGWLESAPYNLDYTPLSISKGTAEAANTNNTIANYRNASLYILCVGTSKYRGDVKSLVYPDLDAAAMAKALEAVGKGLFDKRVNVKLLSTADNMSSKDVSSHKNIETAFKDLASKANPEDVLVVYFSGHGKTYGSGDENLFYYLTKDVTDPDLKDPAVRKNAAISTAELTEWLTEIPALKQVLIFDACNSGKAAESLSGVGSRDLSPSQIRALDRMKDRTGMYILSGSAANQLSFEASEFGQGLLTYSLLEGMSGAALTQENSVDVINLFQHARDRVPVLASQIREIQVPVMALPIGGGSFEIGIKTPSVSIPLAQKKPVFIRSEFQDENFFDNLNLSEALTKELLSLSTRGAQSPLVYIDAKQYDNGYSIRGRYTIESTGTVKANCRLFRSTEDIGDFVLEGKKDKISDLAKAILKEAMKFIK